MYLIIDNYDSFTYNLYQYLAEITAKPVQVYRNDRIDIKMIEELKPEAIIISPGPGRPEEAGVSVEAVKQFAGKIPILGVCLGHQAVAYAFGAEIGTARRIVHGKAEEMTLDGKGLFRTLPKTGVFTRYHSLSIKKGTISSDFEITAFAPDGEIMGIRHKEHILEGVQFHPESIASELGKELLKNFLSYKREPYPQKEMLNKLIGRKDLSFQEAEDFMEELTEGNLNLALSAGFLVALNIKGYTAEEIAGFASVLKRKKKKINHSVPVIDTCGTGGDGKGTFNISSLAALVVASCDVPVAKHGNRAASSLTGSAEFYKELGICIDLPPHKSEVLLEKAGFCFLFAPLYHGAMKHAAPVRKALGIKTIMNLIGPLSNPAEAKAQVIGIYAENLCIKEAEAARLLGVERIMVVHGKEGLDEISVCGPTRIVEINKQGEKKDYVFNPQDIGLRLFPLEELKGGDAAHNVSLAREVLAGKGNPAIKEAVLLNSGAALYIAGKTDSLKQGYETALNALESGQANEKLKQVIEMSNSLAKED